MNKVAHLGGSKPKVYFNGVFIGEADSCTIQTDHKCAESLRTALHERISGDIVTEIRYSVIPLERKDV